MPPTLPQCAHAIVGGSGTAAIEFPEALGDERVRVLNDSISVETPYGQSPVVKHIAVRTPGGERQVLVARMHGWQHNATRHEAALALFWLFRGAGVRRVIAEAGSGSITQHFRPRDLVLPHDVLDLSPSVGGRLDPDAVVLMREPFCPDIRGALWKHATVWATDKATRAFNRAVYASGQGPRFETAAEVTAFARLGADVIGQAIAPEVFLAREIGACYAAMTLVLNYAEGVRPHWDFELLQEILAEDARSLGQLLLDALSDVPEEPLCSCAEYRRLPAATDPAAMTDTA
ncbi:MAG TPA: MTAP family purine nucleoside phosphorylase [Candidatus Angelobacter sp.]|jgi:5'-methylthioadenosine phosphorylase|nr:MTAP family purine nucleoside phosphorylase [Candidatus Angelobacter sp.]